ncbi:Hpt domain-containing protein [Rubrivivax sp. A210]|uniref:Hpt domain-containing protein n=1 Tax=Rubrivivax sp. A210 TaxID=2772301 RepID=UPI0019187FEA|nr:Hpt domain-containing protein [Rubrivivax sp. A210]CAD5374733.1 Hpt domain-containing protein [Rubrivivax sp. A210]
MSTDFRPAPAAAPVLPLDPEALARLRELDPSGQHGVVARVLATYDASLRRLLAQAEAARGDATAVASIAHTLKSSSASVGALSLASSCAAIEARLRGGDVSTLRADVERLLGEGQAALRSVDAMLQERQPQ